MKPVYNNNTTRYKGRSSPCTGLPEVLISFSVALSHFVPKYRTYCRGANPTSKEVCISSRGCTNSQLGDWSTCVRPDLNPGPSAWEANVKPLHHPADNSSNNYQEVIFQRECPSYLRQSTCCHIIENLWRRRQTNSLYGLNAHR